MRALVRLLVPLVAVAAGMVAVAVHLGCSSTPTTAPTSVRGRVSFQGQPLVGALVVFSPDRERGTSGKPIRGETGPDGIFQLQLAGSVAIPPGWYRVAIAPAPSESSPLPGKAIFPAQLRRPDTSKLVREVVTGQEHFFEFAVEVPIATH